MDRIPRNFVLNNISSRLKCPICYDVFYKPRRLFCGHSFCKSCLQELRKNHDNLDHDITCPLCREVIDPKKVGYDQFAITTINELQVTCPLAGCTWKGQYQFLQKHYRQECTQRDKQSMLSQATNKSKSNCSPLWSINIISSDEQIVPKDQDQQEQEIQQDFNQRISAEEYRYKQIKPVQGNKIFVVSRGVQTYDLAPPPPPLPQPRRRRRRRKSVQPYSERPRIRRRRSRSNKHEDVKVQQNRSSKKSKVSRAQQMKDIKQMYQAMGFDFYGAYEQAIRQVKPTVVNVDTPKQIMKERW